jgi:hypothetical protein
MRFKFAGVARDSVGFGRMDLSHFATQQSLYIDIQKWTSVVSEEDLVECVCSGASLDKVEDVG